MVMVLVYRLALGSHSNSGSAGSVCIARLAKMDSSKKDNGRTHELLSAVSF